MPTATPEAPARAPLPPARFGGPASLTFLEPVDDGVDEPCGEPGTPDPLCAAAVDLARAALAEVGVVAGVHEGVLHEEDRAVTHFFTATEPGYVGWHWAVTVSRAPRSAHVTVCETVMVPGEGALSAPAWVPWSDRLAPGDLGPTDVLPLRADDPLLEPGHSATGEHVDEDDLQDWEPGLGRARVLSPEGREAAAARWYRSASGPTAEEALHAAAACSTCGYFVPLSGSLRQLFGVCANEWSSADGRVVSLDHGCGAHSETDVEQPAPVPLPELILDEQRVEAVVVAPLVHAAEAGHGALDGDDVPDDVAAADQAQDGPVAGDGADAGSEDGTTTPTCDVVAAVVAVDGASATVDTPDAVDGDTDFAEDPADAVVAPTDGPALQVVEQTHDDAGAVVAPADDVLEPLGESVAAHAGGVVAPAVEPEPGPVEPDGEPYPGPAAEPVSEVVEVTVAPAADGAGPVDDGAEPQGGAVEAEVEAAGPVADRRTAEAPVPDGAPTAQAGEPAVEPEPVAGPSTEVVAAAVAAPGTAAGPDGTEEPDADVEPVAVETGSSDVADAPDTAAEVGAPDVVEPEAVLDVTSVVAPQEAPGTRTDVQGPDVDGTLGTDTDTGTGTGAESVVGTSTGAVADDVVPGTVPVPHEAGRTGADVPADATAEESAGTADAPAVHDDGGPAPRAGAPRPEPGRPTSEPEPEEN